MNFETLAVRLDGAVATIFLNRPDKANAMNRPMWEELHAAMRWVDETPAIRVAILAAHGKLFTAGIDLALLDDLRQSVASGCAERAELSAGCERPASRPDGTMAIHDGGSDASAAVSTCAK